MEIFIAALFRGLPKNLRSLRETLFSGFLLFYINEYDDLQKQIVLDEDTSKHIVQVLANEKRRES